MQKAIFLDRDGVVNSDIGHYYIFKPEDFILNEGFLEFAEKLYNKGFIFIIISNQGGVAKGSYTKKNVELIHDILISKLQDKKIGVHEIYYCPHHTEYEKCLCRKPGSLMIEKAIARFGIDKTKSFMIGDSARDIEAAQKAGIKGVKIDSNQNLMSIVSQVINE